MGLKSPLKQYRADMDAAFQTPSEERTPKQKQIVGMALTGPSYNDIMKKAPTND